jgi:ribose-phosphate pyrophosphokinase
VSIEFTNKAGEALVERYVFPAGEQHIKVHGDLTGTQIALVRGADAADYIALQMWADCVRASGGAPSAVVPYLPAARADRGVPCGARVYADLINAAELDRVVCFDPHSAVMPELIKNLIIVDSTSAVAAAGLHVDGVIIPDIGAVQRAKGAADALGVPTFQASKHRNPDTGELSHFTCESLPGDGTFLVVDDICDGGGTFLGLAAATGLPKERLVLWVSHGVFSGGAMRLREHFASIITTDSLDPVGESPATQVVSIRDNLMGIIQ